MQLRRGRLFLVILLTMYSYSVFNNLISYRQAQAHFNHTLLDITSGIEWPNADLITALNSFTVIVACVGLLTWAICSRDPHDLATLVTAQCLLLPLISFAQWATVVPDALPNCLDKFAIPTDDDLGWIWTRVLPRACGDVYWATDVGQIIFWNTLTARSILAKRHNRRWVRSCQRCMLALWMFATTTLGVGLALGSRYQYSSDVVLTLVFASLAATHPVFGSLAERMFMEPLDLDGAQLSEETMRMVEMQI